MTVTRLLHAVLAVEAMVVFAAAVVVFSHGLWLKQAKHRSLPRMSRGRIALAELLDGGDGSDGGEAKHDRPLAVLAKLPRRLRTQLLAEAAISVRSGGAVSIADAAGRLGLQDGARRLCRSLWWWRRARGIHLLTVWGDADVGVHHLVDRHPVVRARAIEWAGDHPSPEKVELLLDRLADPTLLCRWRAQDAVLRAGGVATAPLARHLDIATGSRLELLLSLAARRPDSSFHGAALRHTDDERPEVRSGAAALLGTLGGADAAAALESLLADPEAGPRAAAAEGLGRLRHWPAASTIGALLSDPFWDVRRAAAEALTAMGAPGALLLGHYAQSSDEEAAEIARYALDLSVLRRGGPGKRVSV